MFADTVGGANASANLYSLIETAEANDVKPYRYLVTLFEKLPLARTVDDYEALLPWNIALGEAQSATGASTHDKLAISRECSMQSCRKRRRFGQVESQS